MSLFFSFLKTHCLKIKIKLNQNVIAMYLFFSDTCFCIVYLNSFLSKKDIEYAFILAGTMSSVDTTIHGYYNNIILSLNITSIYEIYIRTVFDRNN